jgi:DNA-binding transcriptional LysR family regulator
MDDYATRILPPMLAAFAVLEPAVRLEVQTGLTGRLLEQLGRSLDLVLAMHPAGLGRGQALRREAALWIGATDTRPWRQPVLPLALAPPGCLFRAWALAALDGIGRRWRIVYESPSLGALEAAVAAGLAIGVGKAGTIGGTVGPLGPAAGLPPLPEADIALHRAPGLGAPAARLAEHLVRALGPEVAAAVA